MAFRDPEGCSIMRSEGATKGLRAEGSPNAIEPESLNCPMIVAWLLVLWESLNCSMIAAWLSVLWESLDWTQRILGGLLV